MQVAKGRIQVLFAGKTLVTVENNAENASNSICSRRLEINKKKLGV